MTGNTGNVQRRYGGQVGIWRQLRRKITEDEAPPASENAAFKTSRARGVRIAADVPETVTACRLVWGVWVQALRSTSNGTDAVAFESFVKLGEVELDQRRSVWLPVDGDLFVAYVTGIAGDPGEEGISLAYQLTEQAPPEPYPAPVAPSGATLELTDADTEYSFDVPAGTRRLVMRMTDPAQSCQVWFDAGEVAGGGGFPLGPGDSLTLDGPFWAFRIYAASSAGGQALAILLA